MREFFRGWKRKFGVLTLLLACLFVAGWVRSLRTKDMFTGRRDARTFYYLTSNRSRIILRQFRPPYESTSPLKYHETYPAMEDTDFDVSEFVIESHRQFVGFEYGKTHYRNFSPKFENQIWIVPYWSVVTPLTLISTWLLLSKPRTTKPNSDTRK